ncbi:hypothetical protein ACFVG7_29560, partial [Streptomyces sp. NPDC127112]
MNEAPLADLRDPSTPGPTAASDDGRSAQSWLVDVVARRGAERGAAAPARPAKYPVSPPRGGPARAVCLARPAPRARAG